jgi:hypothetical protein
VWGGVGGVGDVGDEAEWVASLELQAAASSSAKHRDDRRKAQERRGMWGERPTRQCDCVWDTIVRHPSSGRYRDAVKDPIGGVNN